MCVNIGELRALIKDLPDAFPVIGCDSVGEPAQVMAHVVDNDCVAEGWGEPGIDGAFSISLEK